MKSYAVYLQTGEIARTVQCIEEQSQSQVGDGEDLVEVSEGVGDATHYIMGGVAVEKVGLAPEVQVDGLTAAVKGLPPGLDARLGGITAVTDDDPLEIEVDEPGTYKLRIDGGVRYISTTVEITFG